MKTCLPFLYSVKVCISYLLFLWLNPALTYIIENERKKKKKKYKIYINK